MQEDLVQIIWFKQVVGDTLNQVKAKRSSRLIIRAKRYSIRLPKEVYATLSSIIMTRQHTYKRPSFDYAFTGGGFYVYNYLGDGISNINFAIPIAGNKDLIDIIYKAIDNGTVNSTRSLDTLLEEIQSGKRGDIDYIVNALKKRRWDTNFYISGSSRQGRNTRGVSYVSKSNSRFSSTRRTSRNANGLGDEIVKYSLKSLDAVARVDMATAERMVREAAGKAVSLTCRGLQAIFSRLRLAASQQSIYEYI